MQNFASFLLFCTRHELAFMRFLIKFLKKFGYFPLVDGRTDRPTKRFHLRFVLTKNAPIQTVSFYFYLLLMKWLNLLTGKIKKEKQIKFIDRDSRFRLVNKMILFHKQTFPFSFCSKALFMLTSCTNYLMMYLYSTNHLFFIEFNQQQAFFPLCNLPISTAVLFGLEPSSCGLRERFFCTECCWVYRSSSQRFYGRDPFLI